MLKDPRKNIRFTCIYIFVYRLHMRPISHHSHLLSSLVVFLSLGILREWMRMQTPAKSFWASSRELETSTWGATYYLDEDHPRWSLFTVSGATWSQRTGSKSTSLEIDVFVYPYTLVVVNATIGLHCIRLHLRKNTRRKFVPSRCFVQFRRNFVDTMYENWYKWRKMKHFRRSKHMVTTITYFQRLIIRTAGLIALTRRLTRLSINRVKIFNRALIVNFYASYFSL